MVVTPICCYNIGRFIRQCVTSMPALLPKVSYQTLVTVQPFINKYRGFKYRGIITPLTLQMQSAYANTNACHYHSHLNTIPIYYSKHLFCHNPDTGLFLSSDSFCQIAGLKGVRRYHGSSKFTIRNTLFSSYLQSLVEEFDSLHDHPDNNNDKTQLQQQHLLRLNFLKPVVEVIKRLHETYAELQELVKATDGESDKEMKKMMEREVENLNEAIEELENELVTTLVEEDPADQNNIILEVGAGVGGQEAMLFAAEVLSMYSSYACYKGWTITGLTTEESDIGGTRKAAVEISGEDVYKHLKYEAGVHRVQRVPKTEKAGRIHTSTVSVAVLPQPREIDIDIQPKDLKIETFRNSGPGGQSVNTTDSAVRITHIPTGTVSECRQERSQTKNKELAMKNLKHKIYQGILEEQEGKQKATRKMHVGSRSRSEKIRTYNFQQDRITDHRLKESGSDLAVFMTGGEGLDNLISSLADLDKLQTLESMLEEYEMELLKKKSG